MEHRVAEAQRGCTRSAAPRSPSPPTAPPSVHRPEAAHGRLRPPMAVRGRPRPWAAGCERPRARFPRCWGSNQQPTPLQAALSSSFDHGCEAASGHRRKAGERPLAKQVLDAVTSGRSPANRVLPRLLPGAFFPKSFCPCLVKIQEDQRSSLFSPEAGIDPGLPAASPGRVRVRAAHLIVDCYYSEHPWAHLIIDCYYSEHPWANLIVDCYYSGHPWAHLSVDCYYSERHT